MSEAGTHVRYQFYRYIHSLVESIHQDDLEPYLNSSRAQQRCNFEIRHWVQHVASCPSGWAHYRGRLEPMGRPTPDIPEGVVVSLGVLHEIVLPCGVSCRPLEVCKAQCPFELM